MIGITMRRMRWRYPSGNEEVRDGLDTAWWKFLGTALPDALFMPLPNIGKKILATLANIDFHGFILTGGDDPGLFPERDATERTIISYALEKRLPLLGVCRGAQMINAFLGGALRKVAGHIGTRHPVFASGGESVLEVNSWHGLGLANLGEGLICLATDEQGNPEAYASADGLIRGLMWHPEREAEPASHDIETIGKLFAGNECE